MFSLQVTCYLKEMSQGDETFLLHTKNIDFLDRTLLK